MTTRWQSRHHEIVNCRVTKSKGMLNSKGTHRIPNYNATSIKINKNHVQYEIRPKKRGARPGTSKGLALCLLSYCKSQSFFLTEVHLRVCVALCIARLLSPLIWSIVLVSIRPVVYYRLVFFYF